MKSDQPDTSKFPSKWPIRISLIMLPLFVLLIAYMGVQAPPSGPSSQRTDISDQLMAVNEGGEKACPRPLLWKIGTRQMYDYELETHMTLDSSAISRGASSSGEKRNVRINIKGILNFRIFDRSDELLEGEKELLYVGFQLDPLKEVLDDEREAVYVGFQLDPVRVSIYEEHVSEGKRIPELERLYGTFFVTAFGSEGIPLLFYFPEQLDEKDKISLSEIIKIAQADLPLEGHPDEWIDGKLKWHEDETHATGVFRSEYIVYDDECDVFHKKNVQCLSIRDAGKEAGSKELKLTGHVVESKFKGTTAPDTCWLKTFYGSETLQIRLGTAVWSESKSRIKLKLRYFQPDSNLAIWEERRPLKDILKSLTASETKHGNRIAGVWERMRVQTLAEQLGDLSLSQIMTEIKRGVDSGMSQSDLGGWVHKLKCFLELYPEEATFVPDLLKELNVTGNSAGMIILGLELAGHSQAQIAIKSIFEDDDQVADIRLKAIVATGGLANPGKEIIASLFNLVDSGKKDEDIEMRDTALLSLGILSRKLSEGGNPAESQAINDQIISYLQNSENARQRVACLKALGNSASPEIVSVIEPYLSSDSVAERTSAVQSLQSFSDEHTLELLTGILEGDKETMVRHAAIGALVRRGGSEVVEHMRKHLPVEPEVSLRRKMIQFLGKHRTPEVIETLKRQLELENSRPIARDIVRALHER